MKRERGRTGSQYKGLKINIWSKKLKSSYFTEHKCAAKKRQNFLPCYKLIWNTPWEQKSCFSKGHKLKSANSKVFVNLIKIVNELHTTKMVLKMTSFMFHVLKKNLPKEGSFHLTKGIQNVSVTFEIWTTSSVQNQS